MNNRAEWHCPKINKAIQHEIVSIAIAIQIVKHQSGELLLAAKKTKQLEAEDVFCPSEHGPLAGNFALQNMAPLPGILP